MEFNVCFKNNENFVVKSLSKVIEIDEVNGTKNEITDFSSFRINAGCYYNFVGHTTLCIEGSEIFSVLITT